MNQQIRVRSIRFSIWAQVNKRFQERHWPPPAHLSGQPSAQARGGFWNHTGSSGLPPKPPSSVTLHRHPTHMPMARLLGLLPSCPRARPPHGFWAAPAKGARPTAPSLPTAPPPRSIGKPRTWWQLLLPPQPCCTSWGGSKESKETRRERLKVITRFAFLWNQPQFALMHGSWPPELFIPSPLSFQLIRLETDHNPSQEQ